MNTLQCEQVIKGLPPVLDDTVSVALDLELSGLKEGQLHRPFGKMVSLSACFDGKTAYIIFDSDEVQEFLNRIEKSMWIFHNSTFDLGHLRRWATVPERRNMRDTLLIERLMWSNYYDDFTLADLVRRYLKCYMEKDTRKEFIEFDGVMTPDQINYAALDVIGTWLVDQEQQKIISDNDKIIWDNLYNHHVWAVLEFGGFKLDVDKWTDLASKNQQIIDDISERLGNKYGVETDKETHTLRRPSVPKTKELYDEEGDYIKTIEPIEEQMDRYYAKLKAYDNSVVITKEFIPFNPASSVQVLTILKAQGLPVESTGDDEIRPYYDSNEFVKDILDYRKSAKQVTTYGLSFLKNVEADERIYTSLNISKAETGRDCVHGDTVLETNMGSFAISDLPLTILGNGSILTHTGNHQKILRKIYKGKEEMFEVTLDDGSKIKCTQGHKFLTEEGWKHLYELKENDRLFDPPLPN